MAEIKHDCPCCKFLGSEFLKNEQFDLYFCEQNGKIPTVIARWGEDGDYYSGLSIVKVIAKQLISEGKSSSIRESIDIMLSYETTSDVLMLSKAALIALEKGFIDNELNLNIKKGLRLK